VQPLHRTKPAGKRFVQREVPPWIGESTSSKALLSAAQLRGLFISEEGSNREQLRLESQVRRRAEELARPAGGVSRRHAAAGITPFPVDAVPAGLDSLPPSQYLRKMRFPSSAPAAADLAAAAAPQASLSGLVEDPGDRVLFTAVDVVTGDVLIVGDGAAKALDAIAARVSALQAEAAKANDPLKAAKLGKRAVQLRERISRRKRALHRAAVKVELAFDVLIKPKLTAGGSSTTTRRLHATLAHAKQRERFMHARSGLLERSNRVLACAEPWSSKLCCRCLALNRGLGASTTFHCPSKRCRAVLPRDVNGAVGNYLCACAEVMRKVHLTFYFRPRAPLLTSGKSTVLTSKLSIHCPCSSYLFVFPQAGS
jgi:hypothetical protein